MQIEMSSTKMKLKSCECAQGHSTYRFVNEKKTWMDARRFCRQHGGDLVGQHTSSADIFRNLKNCCFTTDQFWIGLENCWSGLYRWVNEAQCILPSTLKISGPFTSSCAVVMDHGGASSDQFPHRNSCESKLSRYSFVCQLPTLEKDIGSEPLRHRSYILQDAFLPEVIVISLVSTVLIGLLFVLMWNLYFPKVLKYLQSPLAPIRYTLAPLRPMFQRNQPQVCTLEA